VFSGLRFYSTTPHRRKITFHVISHLKCIRFAEVVYGMHYSPPGLQIQCRSAVCNLWKRSGQRI